jgi:hypothetical protein
VACIRISFPKTGYETSTWVDDEHWFGLTPQGKNALIFRFTKNHLTRHFEHSAKLTVPADTPNYRWTEI